MKKSFSERAAERLSIGKDILMDIPKLSISGNRELLIENYHTITEYNPEIIRIKTKEYTLKIEGINLNLHCISREELEISGVFAQISFEH